MKKSEKLPLERAFQFFFKDLTVLGPYSHSRGARPLGRSMALHIITVPISPCWVPNTQTKGQLPYRAVLSLKTEL